MNMQPGGVHPLFAGQQRWISSTMKGCLAAWAVAEAVAQQPEDGSLTAEVATETWQQIGNNKLHLQNGAQCHSRRAPKLQRLGQQRQQLVLGHRQGQARQALRQALEEQILLRAVLDRQVFHEHQQLH